MHVQDGASCLLKACENRHVELAKYLCKLGGDELLMLTDKVNVCLVPACEQWDDVTASPRCT